MRHDEAKRLLDAELARLERARQAVLDAGFALDTQRDDLGELSGMDEHVADVASETFEREVGLGLLHEIEGQLRALARARRRLDDGTYGTCRACGTAIPDDRLRAVPATELCVADQGTAELAGAALRRDTSYGAVEHEAAAHLDLLPAEDRPPTPPAAEEAAVHLVGT